VDTRKNEFELVGGDLSGITPGDGVDVEVRLGDQIRRTSVSLEDAGRGRHRFNAPRSSLCPRPPDPDSESVTRSRSIRPST